MTALPLIAYGYILSNFIPLSIGLSRVRSLDPPTRLFLLFIAINAVTEVVNFTFTRLGITNLWFVHLYDLVAYTLLFHVFARFSQHRMLAALVRVLTIVYVLVWCIGKFTFEPFSAPDQYLFTGVGIVFVLLGLVFLFRLVVGEERPPWADPRFWIVGGTFLYFIGNLILFSVLRHFVTLGKEEALEIWSIHWYLNVVVNLVYGRGFWVSGR